MVARWIGMLALAFGASVVVFSCGGEGSPEPNLGPCEAPAPPGSSSCPAACTGGCQEGNVCVIDCDGDAKCDGATHMCPADYACLVICKGVDACDVGTVNCPPTYPCSLVCDGAADACGDVQMNCTDGPCDVACGTATAACLGMVVHCGTGSCSATCGADPKPTMDACQTACSCTEC